jgi:hypothetical protein
MKLIDRPHAERNRFFSLGGGEALFGQLCLANRFRVRNGYRQSS